MGMERDNGCLKTPPKQPRFDRLHLLGRPLQPSPHPSHANQLKSSQLELRVLELQLVGH